MQADKTARISITLSLNIKRTLEHQAKLTGYSVSQIAAQLIENEIKQGASHAATIDAETAAGKKLDELLHMVTKLMGERSPEAIYNVGTALDATANQIGMIKQTLEEAIKLTISISEDTGTIIDELREFREAAELTDEDVIDG